MNRDQIIAALDAGFTAYVVGLFGACVSPTAGRDAMRNFEEGIGRAISVYDQAVTIIERRP